MPSDRIGGYSLKMDNQKILQESFSRSYNNTFVYLGYIVGVQVIDYKDPYLSWAYDVLLVHSLYKGSYHPENFLEDELDKISSLRRYPMKVNSPKVKIGNVIQDKEGFTPIARIVTKINWHSYLNFEDYLDKIPELAPFYSYNLTKWNGEKNSLDESNVRCFVREEINNE